MSALASECRLWSRMLGVWPRWRQSTLDVKSDRFPQEPRLWTARGPIQPRSIVPTTSDTDLPTVRPEILIRFRTSPPQLAGGPGWWPRLRAAWDPRSWVTRPSRRSTPPRRSPRRANSMIRLSRTPCWNTRKSSANDALPNQGCCAQADEVLTMAHRALTP